MKIALLAPFEETVPPKRYGGTELVVYNLAQELVRAGQDVTLFASADSETSAKLVACVDEAVRTSPYARKPKSRQAENLRGLVKAISKIRVGDFDIVHNHFGWQALLFNELFKAPVVTTVHGTLAEPTDNYMYNLHKETAFVSISNSQRRHAPDLNYISTVYNGIQVDDFRFNDRPLDYLAFLGRIHPQKGPEQAIEIARRTGRQLIIGAKVDPDEEQYFEQVIRPLIDGRQIRYLGEVTPEERVILLRNAYALVAPIQWDEPFGIVNIEALACGTPVITISRGSSPEIIVDGKTGFLCISIDEMIARIADIDTIKRIDCRRSVEKKFTAKGMANGYLKAYERVLQPTNA